MTRLKTPAIDIVYTESLKQTAAASLYEHGVVLELAESQVMSGGGWPQCHVVGSLVSVLDWFTSCYRSGDDGQDEYVLRELLEGAEILPEEAGS